MNREPTDLFSPDPHLTGMDTSPDLESRTTQRIMDGARTANGTTRAFERGKEAVTGGVDFASAEPRQLPHRGPGSPLIVSWCGDEVVTVEEYCTYLGELVGKEAIFEYTPDTWCSLVPDTTFMHEVLGHCELSWRDGCRMLVEQCYPELLSR